MGIWKKFPAKRLQQYYLDIKAALLNKVIIAHIILTKEIVNLANLNYLFILS